MRLAGLALLSVLSLTASAKDGHGQHARATSSYSYKSTPRTFYEYKPPVASTPKSAYAPVIDSRTTANRAGKVQEIRRSVKDGSLKKEWTARANQNVSRAKDWAKTVRVK